jgi:hypothetical protein
MISFVKKLKLTEKALLIYVGLCYLASVIRTFDILRFPYVVEYGEATILSQVKTLFDGDFPYNKHLVEIHNYFSYTPFFQYLTSWMGASPEQWLHSARMLNSLSLFAVGILISAIFYQAKGDEKKPIHLVLPMLVWLSWYPVFNWMGLARLDGLALFFQVFGLYFYLRPSGKSVYQVLAMVSLILAFFSKQSAIWMATALIVNDLYNKKLNLYWLIYIVGICTGVAWLNFKSEGTLWTHLVGSNQNVFSFNLLVENLRANVVFHAGLLLIALCGFYKMQFNRQNILTVTLLIMSIPYVIGIGREGSNVNFLLEISVPLTWLLILGVEKLDKAIAGSVLGVGLITFTMFDNFQFRWNFIKPKAPQAWSNYSPDAARSIQNLILLIRNNSGEIWSEDISLPIFAGKTPVYFPFEYMQGISRGVIDESVFLEKIKGKKVDFIIVENRAFRPFAKRFTDKMAEAINANYRVQSQDDFFYVYSPNTK